MITEFQESLPAYVDGNNNTIVDDRISISYRQIPGVFEMFDSLFKKKSSGLSACFALIMENTVSSILMFWYLLLNKSNFFIIVKGSPVNQAIPKFCDQLITVSDDWDATQTAPAIIDISDNPGYKQPKSLLKPCSGFVFLSSSGTTGKPKYILYTVDALIKNATNCLNHFSVNRKNKILLAVPSSHMFGMGVGLIPALLKGANLRLIRNNNIIKLIENLNAFRPDITLLTPALIKMLVLLKWNGQHKGVFISAGEKIPPGTYQEFESDFGPLTNLYGCTELGAIAVSVQGPDKSGERIDGKLSPLKDVQVVVNTAESGHISCRHNAPFSCYADNDGLISADGIPIEWFQTKDVGMQYPDQSFLVKGRLDNCVNRSGFLISLDEVAMRIEELSKVIKQVVVFESAKNSDSITTKLTAVCELNEGTQLSLEELITQCRRQLNRYMVPDRFFLTAKLPRLHTGKPDMHSLTNYYQ